MADALELEFQGIVRFLVGCWEVNLYPLDDQYVPYPQSQFSSLKPLYILRQGLLLATTSHETFLF